MSPAPVNPGWTREEDGWFERERTEEDDRPTLLVSVKFYTDGGGQPTGMGWTWAEAREATERAIRRAERADGTPHDPGEVDRMDPVEILARSPAVLIAVLKALGCEAPAAELGEAP